MRDAVARAERGLVDANLGGGLIKQRVARPGQGRSGGYRMGIIYRARERAIFLFGFAKNEVEHIDDDQLRTMRETAAEFLTHSDAALWAATQIGTLEEITDESENE